MNGERAQRNGLRVTRRGLLIGTGAVGATVVVGAYLGRNIFYRTVAGFLASGSMPGGGEEDPALWFEIGADNVVQLTVPKVEMGQGAHTALAQIAADELGAAWERLRVIQGDTANGPNDGSGTVGSTSVSGLFDPLRLAAATLREMLIVRAAELMGADRSDLTAIDGHVQSISTSTSQMSFGEIVATTDSWPDLEIEPQLKSPADYRYIGRSMPRVDFAAKLRGEAPYGYDLRAEGMAYGAIARPPMIGSVMRSVGSDQARSQPGVIDVVVDIENQFAGVVANTRQQAWDARAKLEIDWQTEKVWNQSEIDELLDVSENAGIAIQKTGNAQRVLDEAVVLSAEYSTPFAVHAQLEPQAALADVTETAAHINVSTQMASMTQSAVATAIGLSGDNVRVTPAYLGGGFGRKTGMEPGVEAARLSQAAGRPVHVGWTREEEMRNGYLRPPTKSRFEAAIEDGRIVALKQLHASGEVLFGFFPAALSYLIGSDPGAWRGAYSFYDGIPNRLLSTHTAKLPVATGSWRGLGLFANTFKVESFMDEMANAANADPLQFRLDHLGEGETADRMRVVLDRMAERARYNTPLPSGRARGIACSIDVGTVVAMCAEISVDDRGLITVHRVTQAIEAGRIVNPDGALAQAEGSIIMGLSSTLIEEAQVQNGVIVPTNFDRYPIITMDRVPEMEIDFIASDAPPNGMGEPAIGPVGAAIANALFNLTGVRVRQVPLTPARVAAAMAENSAA